MNEKQQHEAAAPKPGVKISDPELVAMSRLGQALEALGEAPRYRTLAWALARYAPDLLRAMPPPPPSFASWLAGVEAEEAVAPEGQADTQPQQPGAEASG